MGLILALLLVLLPAAAIGQVLHAADANLPDHPTVQGVEAVNRGLVDRTAGRLSIDITSGTTHSDSFLVAQLRLGRLDMARVNLNALNGIVPLSVVPTLPFMFESRAQKWQALDGPYGQALFASLDAVGLVGLALYDSGAYSFFGRSGFVTGAADLKGKRMRFQKGDTSEAMFRRLGVEPVIAPSAALSTLLATRAVDVVEGSLPDYLAASHWTVAPWFTVSRHIEPPSILIVSQGAWRSLSAQDQALLREAARQSQAVQRALMERYEAEAEARALRSGARLSRDFDRPALKRAFAPLYPLVVREPAQIAWLRRLADAAEPEPAK
jgi:TRAP-type C4-dicarboxylate transport system substrate-binding protein